MLAWLRPVAAMTMLTSCATQVAQTPQHCAGAQFREFDFWLGEWEIAQQIRATDGEWLSAPAQTSVAASADGCVVIEHWSGEVEFFWEGMSAPERIWGFSVRRFDPVANSWSIYWMDQRRPEFEAPYVGGFTGGEGAFYREVEAPDGARTLRITFAQVAEGGVDWELAVSADHGASWTPLWRMAMRRPPR